MLRVFHEFACAGLAAAAALLLFGCCRVRVCERGGPYPFFFFFFFLFFFPFFVWGSFCGVVFPVVVLVAVYRWRQLAEGGFYLVLQWLESSLIPPT